jgi:hypothetical protein
LAGNDLDGTDFGYKIHLVYNALASATSRTYQTIGDSVNPGSTTWDITTIPPKIPGYRPSAHFIVDSRLTPPGLLFYLEKILYGTPSTDPRLPEISEIIDIFSSYIVPPSSGYTIEVDAISGLFPLIFTENANEIDLAASSDDGLFDVFGLRLDLDEDGLYVME